MTDVKEVVRILGGDNYAKKAVELLIKYCDEGYIPSHEIDFEMMLLLEYYRLALPINSLNASLSWDARITTSDKFEIPYIIRFFFKKLKDDGEANIDDVVVEYFKRIGEKDPEDFVEILKEVIPHSKNCIVNGEAIVKASTKRNRDGGVVIAELKGAGLISPYISRGKFKNLSSPLYEINRFVFELISKKVWF